MAITTAQKKQITNWVNSNEFKPVLNEIIEECLTSTDAYFALRSRGIDNKHLLKAEAIVFGYVLTLKIPFLHRPSSKNDVEAKKYAEAKKFLVDYIMKKYGSILEKNINERYKMNGIKTDF